MPDADDVAPRRRNHWESAATDNLIAASGRSLGWGWDGYSLVDYGPLTVSHLLPPDSLATTPRWSWRG